MKILFVHSIAESSTNSGGAEVTLWYLMRALMAHGHDCVLAATASSSTNSPRVVDGVKVYEVGIRNLYWPFDGKERYVWKRTAWHAVDTFNLASRPLIRDICIKESPDVISLHNLPGWSAAIWKELSKLGIPTIQVLHDLYSICVKTTMFRNGGNCSSQCIACRIMRAPHRRQSNYLSAVVGVSEFVLRKHLSLGYFTSVPVKRVINNARDREILGVGPESVRVITGANSRPIRFGFIGRLAENKGIELLLSSFKLVEDPDIELWIAGKGKESYQRYLANSCNDSRVSFLGHVTPKYFYTEVDVVVLPSLWNDTFPGVALESLAFGKPLIGSNRGGIPEMITDGVDGLIFHPDVSGNLYKCLSYMSANAEIINKMSKSAKTSSKKYLDMSRWAQAYIETYDSAISAANS